MKRLFILFTLVFALSPASLFAQLSGDYTVGLGGDYTTLVDAVNDLNNLGISAPTTFNIMSGAYDEQVTIGNFTRSGASTDPVKFAVPSGVVTWQYSSAVAATNWIVKLDKASRVEFKDIDFLVSAGLPNGRLVVLEGGSSNNRFFGGSMTGYIGGPNDESSLVYAKSGVNSFNTIEEVELNAGYRGVDFDGAFGSEPTENKVLGCTFVGQNNTAIWFSYQDKAAVNGNSISDATWSSTNWRGIFIDGDEAKAVSNVINSATGDKGIEMTSQGTTRFDRVLANNMVTMRSDAGNIVGLSLTSGQVDVYHNTVRIEGLGQDSVPIRFFGGYSEVHLRNNIFVNDGGGFSMALQTAVESSDFNILHTSGSFLVEWLENNQADLSAYQGASGLDADSRESTVNFVDTATGDLHLSGVSVGSHKFVGEAIAEVPLDIDSESRDEFNPYKGADEASVSLSPLDNDDTTSGFYTVGGTSPDFSNPSQAVNQLNARGVKGETTFRIRPGTYDVSKVIDDFPRYSTSISGGLDPVEFRASNSLNRPTLRHAATSADDNFIFKLNGADNLVFRALDFVADGLDFWASIFDLVNDADDNSIDDCTLTGVTSHTLSTTALVRSENPDGGDNNSYRNSTFTGGNNAFFLSAGPTGTVIESNSILDFTGTGIFTAHSSTIIRNNNISSIPSLGTFGMSIYGAGSSEILGNTIDIPGVARIGILYQQVNFGSVLMANNFIVSGVGLKTAGGAQGLKFYHNTILAEGLAAIEIDETSFGDNELVNNILHNVAATPSYAVYIDEAEDISRSDYNLYYNGSPLFNIIHLEGVDYATLTDFQAAVSTQEEFSISPPSRPKYVDDANGDLHLSLTTLHLDQYSGSLLPEVAEDFDGDPRGGAGFPVPFIGADEIFDIGALGINADLKAYLSGPYDTISGEMLTTLNSSGILQSDASSSPYANCPAALVGAGFFAANPDLVDWVCIRWFTGTPGSLVERGQEIGFVDKAGNISPKSGSGSFYLTTERAAYWMVVEHRNHLSVMSASPINFADADGSIDFRTDLSLAYSGGGSALRDMGDGSFAMWSGDGDQSGDTTAFDFLNVWLPANGGPAGYHLGDFDLSGDATAFDFLNAWLPANGQASQVP